MSIEISRVPTSPWVATAPATPGETPTAPVMPRDGLGASVSSTPGLMDSRTALQLMAAPREEPAPAPSPEPSPAPPIASLVDRQRLQDLFLDLVQTPGASRHERKVADKITGLIQGMGYGVREDGAAKLVKGDTGNLFVEVPGTVPDAPPLVFISHMDTVREAVGDKPVVRDGVVYSDGRHALGGDNRAGCTELLETLRLLKEHPEMPHPPLQFIFCVGEELGLLGSDAIKEEDLHGRLGFAVDSFHPNEIFFGWDGPLFKGNPEMHQQQERAAQQAFRRPAGPDDQIQARNSAEGFLLDFTRAGIRDIGMQPEERSLWGASSDAASLREKGIPAITIGCGEQDPHGPDEHTSIDDLCKATELVLTLMSKATRYQVDSAGKIVPRPETPPPSQG